MGELFFAADHHLQHTKVLTFRNESTGKFLRPDFKSIEEHDEHIIGRHNAVVTKDDTVYMLGDIAWKTNARTKELLRRLNGRLELIAGNHDHVKWLMDLGVFADVHMWKYMPDHDMILSHVPLEVADLKRTGFNVHGHIHERSRYTQLGTTPLLDPRYMCVSMEQIQYTPVPLDIVKKTREALMNNARAINAKLEEEKAKTNADNAGTKEELQQ